MNARKLRGLVFMTFLVLTVFWAVVSSVNVIDAESNITPTLIVTDRNFLPYIRGLQQGPTATATPRPPTITPSPTITNTPTPTATQEPQLAAPALYYIANGDYDGNYTVAWSAIAGADYYQLQQNFNSTTYEEIYLGPDSSFGRSDMPTGTYCYHTRARGGNQWSDWSEEKCTTVAAQPEPEYLCEFEAIYDGPRKGGDIELLHDGRVFITQTSADSASIFDPVSRSFEQVALPQGGGSYAAVLGNGQLLLTVEGSDPHSMIFDPDSGQTTRLDATINCLGVYSIYGNRVIATFCGGAHGYYYPNIYADYFEDYWLDIGHRGDLDSIMKFVGSFRGDTCFLLTDGVVGHHVVTEYGYNVTVAQAFDTRATFNPEDMATSTMAYDASKIYFTGGVDWMNVASVKEAYVADINIWNYSFERMADMQQARAGHALVAAPNGNVIALGGSSQWQEDGAPRDYLKSIELYVPAQDKWYPAGSLNVARTMHQALQLLNGEIFILGGDTLPGPGHGYDAPPEIGRCQQKQ